MLVYADAAEDSYVEERAARRLRLLPESAVLPFGVALGTEHPVIAAPLDLGEPSDEPDPAFALSDDRDQQCPLSALDRQRVDRRAPRPTAGWFVFVGLRR